MTIEEIYQEKVRKLNDGLNDRQVETLAVIAQIAYKMIFHQISSISIDEDRNITVTTKQGDCDGFVDMFSYGINYVSEP